VIRRGKAEKRENLNLDFFTTASEEQFGEQEKPSPEPDNTPSPPGTFIFHQKEDRNL
jgi:hypothetical protein